MIVLAVGARRRGRRLRGRARWPARSCSARSSRSSNRDVGLLAIGSGAFILALTLAQALIALRSYAAMRVVVGGRRRRLRRRRRRSPTISSCGPSSATRSAHRARRSRCSCASRVRLRSGVAARLGGAAGGQHPAGPARDPVDGMAARRDPDPGRLTASLRTLARREHRTSTRRRRGARAPLPRTPPSGAPEAVVEERARGRGAGRRRRARSSRSPRSAPRSRSCASASRRAAPTSSTTRSTSSPTATTRASATGRSRPAR